MAASTVDTPSIFTTLRYDNAIRSNATNTTVCEGLVSPVYLEIYHHDRLREAAAAMAASRPGARNDWLVNLQMPDQIARACAVHIKSDSDSHNGEYAEVSGAWRCALSLHEDGAVSVKSAPAQQVAQPLLFPTSFDNFEIPMWTVVLDTRSTDTGLTTSFKTSDRDMYDRARQAADISNPAMTKEVLLYSTKDLVMDGSITTPYFCREGQWVTPSESCGGQQGVTRRWALRQGLCSEATVPKHSLEIGETVWLSNAFRGFFPAVLREANSPPAP